RELLELTDSTEKFVRVSPVCYRLWISNSIVGATRIKNVCVTFRNSWDLQNHYGDRIFYWQVPCIKGKS
ncbi:hypothetical protein LINPERPRIM_LOCUS32948, partial [Linum perenne]